MDFLTENIFMIFSAREVTSSERVRFGNPPILGLEYILYFGEISLGEHVDSAVYKGAPLRMPLKMLTFQQKKSWFQHA